MDDLYKQGPLIAALVLAVAALYRDTKSLNSRLMEHVLQSATLNSRIAELTTKLEAALRQIATLEVSLVKAQQDLDECEQDKQEQISSLEMEIGTLKRELDAERKSKDPRWKSRDYGKGTA